MNFTKDQSLTWYEHTKQNLCVKNDHCNKAPHTQKSKTSDNSAQGECTRTLCKDGGVRILTVGDAKRFNLPFGMSRITLRHINYLFI